MQMKSTKKSLVLSLLSLVVCVSMLIGTTFAWFTDSVVSAGNIIKSGNLEVSLEWEEGTVDPANAAWKDASATAIFDYDNWEPGYACARHIKIENEGTLALKYKVVIEATGEVSDLADVIDVYYVDPAVKVTDRTVLTDDLKLGTLTEVLDDAKTSAAGTLLAGKADTITLVLKMQETAGNEYENKSIGDSFAVKLFATQLASEKDSFDENYDALADYDGEISNQASLQAAVNQGGSFLVTDNFNVSDPIEVGEDTEVTIDLNGNEITTTADDGYVINNTNGGTLVINDTAASTTYSLRRTVGGSVAGVIYTENSTTIINGGTYNAVDGGKYVLLNSKGTLVINNAVINGGTSYPIYSYDDGHKLVINNATVSGDFGSIGSYGEGTVEINGGSFTANGSKGKTHHCVYVGSKTDLVINDGIFAHNGAGISDSGATITVYAGANGGATINGGTFTGSGTYIAPFDKYDSNCYFVINGGNFSKDPTKYLAEGLQAIKVGDTYTVVPDSYEETGYAGLYKDGNTFFVYTAEGFEGLNQSFKNKTVKVANVKLMDDIDMTGKTWTPVDSHVDFGFEIDEFDGQGHTISNLTINGQAMFTRFAGLGDVTFKNVTFDNATVNSNGNLNTAILTVQTYQNILLDNVDVKNSSITGGYKVAPLIGTVYNENPSSITATIKNCDVSDTVVTSSTYDFFTCGMVAFVYTTNNDYVEYENCSITNVQLRAVSGGYNYHANIHYTSADTDDQVNEHPEVKVTNVTFEKL